VLIKHSKIHNRLAFSDLLIIYIKKTAIVPGQIKLSITIRPVLHQKRERTASGVIIKVKQPLETSELDPI